MRTLVSPFFWGKNMKEIRTFIGNPVYFALWITFVIFFVALSAWLVYLISRHLKLNATLSVFSQYHTQDTIPYERILYTKFCNTAPHFALHQHDIETDISKHIISTLRVYERLALLVRKGGVNKRAMLYLIGDVCVRLWLMLEQHIRTERERRGDRFWHLGVEYLTMLSLDFHIKNSRGELTIYHPDEPENKSKQKTYSIKELTEELQKIKTEMKKMKDAF